MHCPKCGNKLEEGTKFCAKCGNSVGQPNHNVREDSEPNPVLKGVVWVVAFVVAFGVVRYLTQESTDSISEDTASKEEIIDQLVQEVEASTVFPNEIDEITTWTGITATTDAIRYQYTLHDVDETQINTLLLKENAVSFLCQDAGTRSVLDEDIGIEYSYAVQGSIQTFFVSIRKADCL